MNDRIKFGMIGVGGMGRGHLKDSELIEEAEVVAIADNYQRSLEEASKLLPSSVKKFKRYEELLDIKEIDAVIISTPNCTHRKITVDALESGKHVLCEKPMATTIEDCDEMIEAAKRNKKILQIGLELRYAELYRKMRELIKRGDIGKVQLMWCKEFRCPFLKKVGDWILKQKESGGSLVEKDCHHFDLFNWMIGSEPVKVSAFGGQNAEYREKGKYATRKDKGTKVDVIDNAWVITEYENGARSCLGLCFFSPYGDNFLEVGAIGDNGRLESFWREKESQIIHWSRKRADKTVYSLPRPDKLRKLGHGGASYNELIAFIGCIKNNKKPFVDGKIGKESTLLPLAAEKSIKEKRMVRVGELEKR